MSHELDVICVGSANLDTIAVVDHTPADDERVTTDGFVTAGGGPAATAAVALARLGARVGICAVVGDDGAGERVRMLLHREGVDTRWLRTDTRSATAQAYIMASRTSGGRSIVTTVGTEPADEDVPVGISRWLHVDQTGFAPTHRALKRARGGTLLSVDAGNPIPGLTLDGVDLFAPTLAALLLRYETQDVGAAFAAARHEGARDVVATAGTSGTYVATREGVHLVKAFTVDIASTLGAGDVFHGALLAGLVRGEQLVAAARAANAAAALACMRLDGRSGIPSRAGLTCFLESYGR